jgi:hypothetical protein
MIHLHHAEGITFRSPPETAESNFRSGALVLQPGFRWAPGALAPVTVAGALLMPPTPGRPVRNRLKRRRPLPDQVPEQASDFRHGERQQPPGVPCGGFSP